MNIGFLFGAGAEVGYGLPSGGKFALEIFRQDTTKSKAQFKEMRDAIDSTTRYAANWLPDDYKTKNIGSYGKTVFESIIRDTIEHNRERIIEKLNNFDDIAVNRAAIIKAQTGKSVEDAFLHLTNRDVQNMNMQQSIAFTDSFKEGNKIFSNNYFSALLFVYKDKEKISVDMRQELGKILISIMQLQIGALSENLSRKINDNLFSRKDDSIDLFDDIGEIIQLNYRSTGISGLEYLLESKRANNDTDEGIVLYFAQELIEEIFSSVLDYKSLIDSNWHYLYCPKAEWAKFCKISIFLLTVRNYIMEECSKIAPSITEGYYHDLKNALLHNKCTASAIATTNYNSLISDILGDDISFMNGSTTKWYDPYINRIGFLDQLSNCEKHFMVPLLFTQSGTKSMTSIDMSIEYVNIYNKFSASDVICTIGFGFNADDEHINGILRSLIDDKGKMLVAIDLDNDKSNETIKKQIVDKLKVVKSENITVILVDRSRRLDGINWIDNIVASH